MSVMSSIAATVSVSTSTFSADMERRLSAILAADVVGYSRLVRADEEGTITALRTLRTELFEPKVSAHDGRIVKLMGDGLLAEFASAVGAVRMAAEVQQAVAARNADLSEAERIDFRIGINLGDVIIDGDDIQGDGVNVAARLESLADPGGICISGAVHEQVRDRLELAFEDMGEREVKNIARPIRIWRWAEVEAAADGGAADPESAASPALPSKPSIAVLPFTNMSGDPEQDYFADGITEDILTELSRFRELFVISRTSAFTYKGKTINIQQVAKELNVQYVAEGSVRKAGNRVRVTVQLIEAESDRHVWAERYDRDLADIFEVQDEITSAIVGVLPGRIEAATQERAGRKLPENMAAYEYVLAGKLLHHRSRPGDNEEAQRLLDRAIELEPNYAHAHSWKACTLGQSWVHGWCEDKDSAWEQVGEELEVALALDDNDSDVHRVLAAVKVASDDHDKAVYHQERALSLNPNDDLIVVQQGEILTWLGRPEEGIEWIQRAMRRNPYHPERFWNHLGRAYFVARRYDEAIEAFKRITAPDHTHHAFLAACYAEMGDEAAAAAKAGEVLKKEPTFSVDGYMTTMHYKQDSDRQHHRDALLKAKLPA